MLAGCKVLDCAGRLGWLAGRMLADLGATVLKLERPGAPEPDRAWHAFNVNKRRLTLDPGVPGDRRDFERLVGGADILIETSRPGSAAQAPFDPERLRAINRRLVHVSITPFGAVGPRAAWRASDIEIMAASGAMSLAGEPDGEPVRVSAPQSPAWAGANGAVGALVALYEMRRSGCGQQVEVSAQRSVIPALAHAPAFWDLLGEVPTRCGAFITGRAVTGAVFRAFWPCADGYLNFSLYGGPAGRRTGRELVAWMRERGADPGELGCVEWTGFDPTVLDQSSIDRLERPIARFFLRITKGEFLDEASRREMLGYPVSTVADIAADPQLEARRFWQDLRFDGGVERHCGPFVLVDGERPRLRHAPAADISRGEALALFSPPAADRGRGPAVGHGPAAVPQALAGLKVVEFGGYAAGPHVGKVLADFGATVVHVESRGRPDGFRLQYPPFKGREPGLDRGGCFTYFNDSKYAVTLDLKHPPGRALARRLVGWADAVVENMRPGVMARLGLGYGEIVHEHPGLVLLSTCNMGQTGPRANTPGFGSQLSAHAGFCGLTGARDGPPMLLYGPYIDFIASIMGTAAVLAAVERRRRTGRGAWLDQSQFESGLHFIAPALLEFFRSATVAQRDGNRDPVAVPHGAYRTAAGGWIALSCWSDEEFARLAAVMERVDMAADRRYRDAPARRAHTPELDAAITAWARGLTAGVAADRLQAAGVHAYRVNSVADLFSDPQLVRQHAWRVRRHRVIGDQAFSFPGFDLMQTPGDITAAGPLLGADNETVFREFLGLDAGAFESLAQAGAFD